MFKDLEELDRLTSNMHQKEIENLLSVLELYITERSMNEIKQRIESEETNPTFEWKMRWSMDFKKFMEDKLKD